jgi:hypothetical protein
MMFMPAKRGLLMKYLCSQDVIDFGKHRETESVNSVGRPVPMLDWFL